jgi:bifunctional UDP-N-acetylglucosamine pyrophosphorylase / glucosamine-1-phosphate N-acetyltransferase
VSAPVFVILAAGQGTRMRSATPKLLHPVCGRAMIAWPVAAARAAGAGKIVVVEGPDGRLRGAVGGELGRWRTDEQGRLRTGEPDGSVDSANACPSGSANARRSGSPSAEVEFAVQEEPRGTADAVKAAVPYIDPAATVVVLNGDHPLITPEALEGLVQAHGRSGAVATLATAVLADPSGYGRVVRAPDGTIERVVETKAPGDASESELHIREINTGIYVFEGGALIEALGEVRSHNVQGEFYLPDVLPILRSRERSVIAHEIGDASELGVNDRVGLAAVRAVAQRRIHERHMLAGVTIVDPASTVIDVDVRIGQDAVVAPFSSLHGSTEIGSGAKIGPLSTLIDTRVGAQASVVHSYLHGGDVGERANVGPFSYLRPGAVLREGSKAGAFVEIKNSDIGPGTKVPHLSYIGDTDIGERSNIGAGTITANYDGTNKNRTRIGAGAFLGVDTMLVAPVTVGDDAYTGAGSVITEDIPPGALGIARSHQANIEGYRERRKERDSTRRQAEAGDKNVPAGAGEDKVDTKESDSPD